MKDYYSLLGVETSATPSEIKKNYRLLVTKFHPDKNPDPDAASKFIVITEAYDVLSDKKSRALYDLQRYQVSKKKQEEVDYSFTAVVPPTESLKVRRRKAQQKRSTLYQHSTSTFGMIWRLFIESGHIVSRYILPVSGITLMMVIVYSAGRQLPSIAENAMGMGVIVFLFVLGLVYGIGKIVQFVMVGLDIDIRTFSVIYKISQLTASVMTLGVLILVLIIVFLIDQLY